MVKYYMKHKILILISIIILFFIGYAVESLFLSRMILPT